MSIRENLLAVLNGFEIAKSEEFTAHPLAHLLRTHFPHHIRWNVYPDDDLLLVKGSAGQGGWVRGPWVALLDRLVTDSPQRGFYPVYLFAEDMSSVYLSINQGMTQVREKYRANTKTTLRARSENFRAMLGTNINPFTTDAIDLAPSSSTNETSFYESGNICSIRYTVGNMPPEQALVSHLNRAIQLYQILIDTGAAEEDSKDEDLEVFTEGGSPARVHLRVERNRKLISKVKKLKGDVCEACYLKFSDKYGSIGNNFIEAHHLVPFASLTSRAVPLDPVRDFAVLCANCHRMAHRMSNPSDIEALRTIIAAHNVYE